MVDDDPTPIEFTSGTAVPLARAPKVYCIKYFPAITCIRLSGRTSAQLLRQTCEHIGVTYQRNKC